MGVVRIDFGSVELKERKAFKALADNSKVRAITRGFKFGHAGTGTPFIEVKYEIDDDEARDIDGGTDYGSLWDKIYFSEKSVKMAKMKLKALGVDVDSLVIEDDQDLQDLVEDMRDTLTDRDVVLVTENEPSFKDETVPITRVKFINEAS
jgi:arginyl-tRNA synthetase